MGYPRGDWFVLRKKSYIHDENNTRTKVILDGRLAIRAAIRYRLAMMSVLIECGEDAATLGASLAALVPGAVEGLIREVIVIDRGLDAATRKVADHAGCRVAPAEALREAVAGAKGEWLMLLEPGARLSADWIEATAEHLAGAVTPRAGRFSLAAQDRPGFLRRLSRRTTALRDGLILPKAQAVGLAAKRDALEGMAQGLATARLGATIRPRTASERTR